MSALEQAKLKLKKYQKLKSNSFTSDLQFTSDQSSYLVQPSDPVEPTIEPIATIEPSMEVVEPVEPVEPVESAESVEPAQPAQPIEYTIEYTHQEWQVWCDRLNEEIARLQASITSTSTELEKSLANSTHLSGLIQDRDTTIEIVSTELRVLEQTNAGLLRSMEGLQTDNEGLGMVNNELKRSAAVLMGEHRVLEQTYVALNETITKSKETHQVLDSSNTELQDALSKSLEEHRILQQTNSNFQQKIAQSQEEHRILQQTNANLQRAIAQSQDESRAAQSKFDIENETLRNRIIALESNSNPLVQTPQIQIPVAQKPEETAKKPEIAKVVKGDGGIDGIVKTVAVGDDTRGLENRRPSEVRDAFQIQISTLTIKLMDLESTNKTLTDKIARETSLYSENTKLQGVVAQLKNELDKESRVVVLLQAEVDTLPDMIQRYHDERKALLRRINQGNFEKAVKETVEDVLVVVNDFSCVQCKLTPLIEI